MNDNAFIQSWQDETETLFMAFKKIQIQILMVVLPPPPLSELRRGVIPLWPPRSKRHCNSFHNTIFMSRITYEKLCTVTVDLICYRKKNNVIKRHKKNKLFDLNCFWDTNHVSLSTNSLLEKWNIASFIKCYTYIHYTIYILQYTYMALIKASSWILSLHFKSMII